jgi:uncharacterized RDD family membrane protein YckC
LSSTDSLLDNNYSLETPEGVDLEVELAGPVIRTLAFVIDFAIRALIMFALSLFALFTGSSETAWAIVILAWFIIEWWYPVLFEVLRRGQTPGKKSMGISVINDDLTPIGLGSSLIRNLLRFVDFLPSMYTIGLATIVMNNQFKRLGDIAAGTIVIYDKAKYHHDLNAIEQAAEIPPFDLTEDEQSAFVEFTTRQDTLTEARQQELADILADELPYTDYDRIKRIRGVGAWLLGSRN